MKNFRLNFKSIVQRKARWLITLIAILTLGVGQMWGYVNGSAYLYFNPDGKWSYTKYYFAAIQEHDSWQTKVYELSKISHTNLYYLSTTEWNDADYITFGAQNGNFSGGYWGYDSFKSFITMCGEKCNWGLDYTKTYTFKPSANTKGTSINPSYHSGGYSDLNHNQTVYKYTSNGGTSAASYTAQSVASGTVTISAYKMTGNGTASNSSNSGTISEASTTSLSKKAAYTGEVTLTASPNANYIFEGWYESTSATTPLSTDLEYTYNAPNSTKSVYARFRYEQTYTITIANNKTAATTTQQVGATTPITITAPSVTDHVFSTWEVMPANVTKYSGNLTDESIQIRATAAATVTADFNLIPCSIVYKFGSGNEVFKQGETGVTTTAMSYDVASNAYYKDVTTSGTQLNFRFYYNNSQEYATAWNGSYPGVYSVDINGTPRNCTTEVQVWGNKSSIKVTYASGTTSLRVWYSKQTGKAWVTETTYSVSIASENTNRGTVNKSSVTAGRNTASASFQATPVTNSGWMFKQWSATSPASLVSSETTNPNTVKATGTDGSVQAQFKHRYILRGSIDADGNPAGGMAGWDATDNSAYATASISDGVMTITANLTKAKTKYKFKIYDLSGSSWKGQAVTTDIPDNTARTLSSSNNVTLTTTAAGTYTFVYTVSSNSIKVLFPSPVYSVTYGVQSGTGTVTAKIGTESIGASPGKAVGGANVVMTASDGTGYQFQKWVNESGTQISTSNPYTISSIAANCTIKAVFTARNYTATNNLQDADGNAGQYNVDYDATSIAHTSEPSRDGYTIEGYYIEAGWSNKIANTNLSLVSSTTTYTSGGQWKYTSAPNLHIKWQQTLTLAGNGAGSTNGSLTMTYNSRTTSGHTKATRTGYTLKGYYTATSDGNKVINADGSLVSYSASVDSYLKNSSGEWIYDGTPTLSAQWTANSYNVTLKANTGTGSDQLVSATYDADMPTTLKDGGGAITVHTKTGYKLLGYWDATSDGNQYYSYNDATSTLSSYRTWNKAAVTDLYAHWQARQYTVTLDQQSSATGYSAAGTLDASKTVTYDALTPEISGTVPTAATGYCLMGFYTEENGAGVKVVNADKSWVASVAGYTDASYHWIHAGNVTLYAYYKKAEITDVTISGGNTIAPSTSTSVTATISPTPAGTTSICWRLLYDNGNVYSATFTPTSGATVSFTSPSGGGNYKLETTLVTGTSCGSGEELDQVVTDFTVASDHTVTVQYKYGDYMIAASTTADGKPLAWTEITAPAITGYTFSKWKAGEGITINGADGNGEKASATIQYKASYDGTLTAIYNKKNVLYFNNTLGWEHVYVYFYSDGNYWQSGKNNSGSTDEHVYGSGAKTTKVLNSTTPYSAGRHGEMRRIEGTNIFYFDYLAESYPHTNYVTFTKDNQHDYEYFDNTEVVRLADVAHYYDKPGTMPMYVPLPGVYENRNKHDSKITKYYTEGYWMNYPENTGYTLKIFDKISGTPDPVCIRDIPFEFTGNKNMPMSVTVELDAGVTYGFKIYRNDGTWWGNNNTMKAGNSGDTGEAVWEFTTGKNNCGLKTSVAGNYTFTLSYGPKSSTYYYLVGVHYPVAANDYRILYNDRVAWSKAAHGAGYWHESRTIHKEEDAKDIVSFYVSKEEDASASMKFQYASAVNSEGVVTWTDVASGSIDLSSIKNSGVYNFHLTQSGGSISVEKIEPYTGMYYIRTDCAGSSKWANYKETDHHMTYSDYAEKNSGYSHYYCHWVTSGTNVKFCIANDYSMCISDTLSEDYGTTIANITAEPAAGAGTLNSGNASIRFMWDQSTNKISRAYISGSSNISDRFLVLEGDARMFDKEGNALSISGLNANEINLVDDQNFLYEQTIQVNTTARAKLTAKYNTNVQYFRGTEGAFADGTTVELLGGSASGKHKMRIVYDFKTDRLVTAYIPSATVSSDLAINADLMLVREHQDEGQQLKFSGEGKLSAVHTVYGVMRFNRWILNNRQHPEDLDVEHCDDASDIAYYHAPLAVGSQKSIYERALYFISFPFDVNLSDVFGFGTYWNEWYLEYYDGAERAKNGFWADSPSFWKYVTPEMKNSFVLEAGKGYILGLDLDYMAADNFDFWNNRNQQVELFFPSADNVSSIKETTASISVPEHNCTIGPRFEGGDDRRIKDSHWNIIGVPSYANYGSALKDGSNETITWNSNPATEDLPFLYKWNANDNTLTAQSGSSYPFKSMHAYVVQYTGTINWLLASATPASLAPRRSENAPQDVEFRMELQQAENAVDQTFVRLSNKETVTANFDFNYDLGKEFNKNKSNIYTIVEGYIQAAGNCMPMTNQTTVIPVGVNIATNGDYTFSIPEGTEGIGVTLIDTETGIRTSLSALDYTIHLNAGTYDNRFVLEISPSAYVPTDIDEIPNDETQATDVRKVMIDGVLYIVKDGKMYDARGSRVQ